VYSAIADGAAEGTPVGHGHTYSVHPVSAAVGLEVLRLYHEGGLLANGIAQGPRFEEGLQQLPQHPLVGDFNEQYGVGLESSRADLRRRLWRSR
jgi:adenosylmethionine-8-amino-7-oxononanoate aminotransferase